MFANHHDKIDYSGSLSKVPATTSRWRKWLVGGGVTLILGFVVYSVIQFQFGKDKEFWQNHTKTHGPVQEQDLQIATRGKILDRNGGFLALNENRANVFIDPYHMPDFEEEYQKIQENNKDNDIQKQNKTEKLKEKEKLFWNKVSQVAIVLDLPDIEVRRKFEQAVLEHKENKRKLEANKKKTEGEKKLALAGDMSLVNNISQATAEKLEELNVTGIKITSRPVRIYPDGEEIAQLIGYTSYTQKDKKSPNMLIGKEGIERSFDKKLAGENGIRIMVKSNSGGMIHDQNAEENVPVTDGEDIVLSLDRRIQNITFNALKYVRNHHRADSASAVVLDAKTGEILAIANYPSFNPEEQSKVPLEDNRRKNIAVMDAFEPGSTIKPLIVAKALDDKKVSPHTTLVTTPYVLENHTIKDSHSYPQLTVSGVIQKSSNVGTSKIARMIGKENLYNYLLSLDFNKKPDSGIPAESKGRVNPWKQWSALNQANIGYGYHLQVSLLQLAKSYTAITNDGTMLPVSILKQNTPPQGKHIISSNTAREINKMMQSVTAKGGTGTAAAIDGYSVGGKTGTAHKSEGKKGYTNAYRSSFVGFAPANNPKLIVAVMIDNPRENGHFGGTVAAPAFAEIMKGSLAILGVPPDKPLLADEKKVGKK